MERKVVARRTIQGVVVSDKNDKYGMCVTNALKSGIEYDVNQGWFGHEFQEYVDDGIRRIQFMNFSFILGFMFVNAWIYEKRGNNK